MAMNFDKEALHAAFKKHAGEVGKSDTLNLVEFGDMFIELVGSQAGYDSKAVKAMFDGICGDDDECTFDEFWTGITGKPATKNQLEQTFKKFDKDNSGSLSKEEITAAFKSMPNCPKDEQIQKALADVDANDDGKVSLQEFLAIWPEA